MKKKNAFKDFYPNIKILFILLIFLLSFPLLAKTVLDSLFNELHTSEKKSKTLLNISYHYYNQGKKDKFLEYLKKTKKTALKEKNYAIYMAAENTIILESLNENNLESQILKFKQIYKKIPNDSLNTAIFNYYLGKMYFYGNNFKKALTLFLSTKNYLERKKNYSQYYYESVLFITDIYIQMDKFKEAITLYKTNIDLAKSQKNQNAYFELNFRLAIQYMAKEIYDKALNIFYDILTYKPYKPTILELANIYQYIGMILEKDNPSLAENYYKKALAIYQKNNAIYSILNSYNNLALIYSDKKEYDKSMEYYEKALTIAKQVNDYYSQSVAFNNIGEIYRENKNFDKSMEYYKKALSLYRKDFFDDDLPAVLHLNIAIIYFEKGSYYKAIKELAKINNLRQNQISNFTWQSTYELYSKIYEKLHQYRKSLEYLHKYLKLEQQLNSQQQKTNINKLQLKLETMHIDEQLKLLKKDKKIKELEIQKEKYQNKYFRIIGIFLLLGILVLGYAYYITKKSQKQTKILNEKLDALSRKDPLTKLSNRRDIIEKIEYEIKRTKRNNQPLTFILGDIDYFKHINDTYGHDCGDFVLKEIAKIFKKFLREQDFVARWGGEEFLIVLPETDISNAFIVAEKLRKKIEEAPFEYNGQTIKVTITFGLSQYETHLTIDQIVQRTDVALYMGKKRGRNCSVKLEEIKNTI